MIDDFAMLNDKDELEIDPDDLIIISETHNWKPTKEMVLAYANQLGFDIQTDPPEMLSIAEKYLSKDIPDTFRRAFHKASFQLVYINMITKEIEISTEYEELAKEEYLKAKEKYIKEIREKEINANKATIIPRKKIAPIGAKKTRDDPIKRREKEFMKKVEKTFKESEREKENQDIEIRRLKEQIKKEEKSK